MNNNSSRRAKLINKATRAAMGNGGKFDKVLPVVITEGAERVEDNRGGSRGGTTSFRWRGI